MYPAKKFLIESPLVYFLVCVLIKITTLVEIPSRPGRRELPIIPSLYFDFNFRKIRPPFLARKENFSTRESTDADGRCVIAGAWFSLSDNFLDTDRMSQSRESCSCRNPVCSVDNDDHTRFMFIYAVQINSDACSFNRARVLQNQNQFQERTAGKWCKGRLPRHFSRSTRATSGGTQAIRPISSLANWKLV